MKDESRLSVDALVRSLAVSSARPVCYLLGAGASITSGVPSAERCLWEWKQDIFVTNNPTLRDAVGELSLPGTKHRVQRWLDQRGCYPALGDLDEYSVFAKECYPTGTDRRAFFQAHVAKAKPHTGYKLLALLAKARLVQSVWTTNFDGLVARACAAANQTCIEVGMDTPLRAMRPQAAGELRVVSLHGDYRYDTLKNTLDELQTQEVDLRKELLHELKDCDLVVVGYSGRDRSLMDVLIESYTSPGKTRLFWCGFGDDVPAPVEALIERAGNANRDAFFVQTEGFDDLISRLALRQLEGDLSKRAKEVLASVALTDSRPAPFAIPDKPPTSLIKSNAYPFTYPTDVLKIGLKMPADGSWRDWINERFPQDLGVTVTMDGGALVMGTASDIRVAFDSALVEGPVAAAISDADLARDGRIQSLYRRALVQSVARLLDVDTDGGRRIWDKLPYRKQEINKVSFNVHRALAFRIESINGVPHSALMPDVVVNNLDGTPADDDFRKAVRNAIYGYQHNHVFDADLRFWTERVTNVDIPSPGGSLFRIGRAPLYAGLYEKGRSALPGAMRSHAKQKGMVVADADLLFSSLDGRAEVANANPLKGLVENRPWDYRITASGLSPSVEISVICPNPDSAKIKRWLSQFQERSTPTKQELDYLHPFPGFSSAFGLPLVLPDRGNSDWLSVEEPGEGDPLKAAKDLARRICRALDTLRAVKPRSVVTIFVPFRWAAFEHIETDKEKFDLHHLIKAYAARHGQSTQFIRERTTVSPQPCRVRWWLSLALYVKALRTPWRLDCLDDQTAFVGIGYGLDLKAEKGRQVLLGCSHLYNGRGEGLQFRLGKIESPIIRGRNPYMSLDDARRTGETIRQLFFDSKLRLPNRVVVHKRTPFTDDEQRGLAYGLEGVDNIELIEVTVEESLRYLASKMVSDKLAIDTFPIPRGSLVILNANSALVWVHGVTPNAANPKWKYYQGKRRIPTPLLVRRYRGNSDISLVATEILGLSKMNWNTFDYYSRLPATLDSASALAKVGAYLSGFGAAPYDYRLLI